MFVNYVSVINNIVFVNVCIAGDYCIICQCIIIFDVYVVSDLQLIIDDYVIFNYCIIQCVVVDGGVSINFNVIINMYRVKLRNFNLFVMFICIVKVISINYGFRLN